MKIVIQDKVIETKEIIAIKDWCDGSRRAGFKIYLDDGSNIPIYKNIPYESYPSDIRRYYDRINSLKQQVIEQWEKDSENEPAIIIE